MTYAHEQAVNYLNKLADMAQVEWAVNEVENFIRNINFAGAARCCADLKAETGK